MSIRFHSIRAFGRLCLALAAIALCATAARAQQEIPIPAWFKMSFLDLREDLKEASAARRQVMLYFGQNGCSWCKRLVEVNFRDPAIVEKTRAHFDVIEINIVGSREVTWIDGTVQNEKSFARNLKIGYTPTLIVLDERGGVVTRMNGYLAPPAFSAALDYVIDGVYRREPDLQRYLKSRGDAVAATGSRVEATK